MIDNWGALDEFQDSMGPHYSPSEYALGLFMEVSELTESFQFKPWRPDQEDMIDRENFKREVIDCLFFLHHLCRCFDITQDELDAKFEAVLQNNLRRYVK